MNDNSILNKIYVETVTFILGGLYDPTDTGIEDVGNLRSFDSNYPLGLYLYSGEILLNKKLIDEGCEESIKTLFYHEKGHEKQGPIKYGTIGSLVLSPPLLIFWILLISGLTYTAFTGEMPLEIFLFKSPELYLSLIVSIVLTSSISSYIAELNAEFYCINRIGLGNYRKGREDIESIFEEKNIIEKFFVYVHHPPPKATTLLYEAFSS